MVTGHGQMGRAQALCSVNLRSASTVGPPHSFLFPCQKSPFWKTQVTEVLGKQHCLEAMGSRTLQVPHPQMLKYLTNDGVLAHTYSALYFR